MLIRRAVDDDRVVEGTCLASPMKFLHPLVGVAYLCPGSPCPQAHTGRSVDNKRAEPLAPPAPLAPRLPPPPPPPPLRSCAFASAAALAAAACTAACDACAPAPKGDPTIARTLEDTPINDDCFVLGRRRLLTPRDMRRVDAEGRLYADAVDAE